VKFLLLLLSWRNVASVVACFRQCLDTTMRRWRRLCSRCARSTIWSTRTNICGRPL